MDGDRESVHSLSTGVINTVVNVTVLRGTLENTKDQLIFFKIKLEDVTNILGGTHPGRQTFCELIPFSVLKG